MGSYKGGHIARTPQHKKTNETATKVPPCGGQQYEKLLGGGGGLTSFTVRQPSPSSSVAVYTI